MILAVYHFYNHYRFSTIADVSFSRGALPRQTGVLKFLSDIYASLYVYMRDSYDWYSLIRRASEVASIEILTYGFFYLEFFYGKNTIPEAVRSQLLSRRNIAVPILRNTIVHVDAIGKLLNAEIRTPAGNIGPDIWMFRPQDVPEMLIHKLRGWKAKGNELPNSSCLRVSCKSIYDGMPIDCAWELARDVSLDEEHIDPRQFFLTHVTGGVWPIEGGVTAKLRSLWNHQKLYLRIDVYADEIRYVRPEYIEFGECINIYISDGCDEYVTRKIALTIGEGGNFAQEPVPEIESLFCRRIELTNLEVSVCTSKNHYRVDLAIPWNVLAIAPTHQLYLGFDLEVIHRTEEMTTKTAIAWSGGRFLSERFPEFHGGLVLLNECVR